MLIIITAQWFLTEVHYKYNSIIRIRDLSEFWSITVLDLSHNNIKRISGFENLRYDFKYRKQVTVNASRDFILLNDFFNP